MNTKAQRLCIWLGLTSIPLFFIGWWPLANFLPPFPPAWEAQKAMEFYRANPYGIKLFAIIFMYAGSMLIALYAAISCQLKRIEGDFGPISIAQIGLGVYAVVPFLPATAVLAVLTYRLDTDPATLIAFSDFFWLLVFMISGPAVVQFLLIGYAILNDRHAEPILPRWLGYFTIWAALLTVPGVLCAFFQVGPFAWNGVIGFWIPTSLFGIWTIVIALELLKAVQREEDELNLAGA